MRRLARHFFTILSALSLLLCAATCMLWARSYIGGGVDWVWPAGVKFPPQRFQLRFAAGDVAVDWRLGPFGKPVISYWQTTGFTLIHGTMSGRRFVQILMPLWMPAAFLLLLPLIRTLRWYRMRSAAVGRCPVCGYDLRASPERCPECGTAVNSG